MTTSFQQGLCEYFTPPSLWPRYVEMEAIVLIVWRMHGQEYFRVWVLRIYCVILRTGIKVCFMYTEVQSGFNQYICPCLRVRVYVCMRERERKGHANKYHMPQVMYSKPHLTTRLMGSECAAIRYPVSSRHLLHTFPVLLKWALSLSRESNAVQS